MPQPATAASYFRDSEDAAVFSDPSLLALLKERGVATPAMPLSHLQPPPPWATVRCLPQMIKEPTPTEDGVCVQPLASLPKEGVEVSMAEVAAVGGGIVPMVPSALHHRRYRVFPLGPICGVTDAATIQPCEDVVPASPQTSDPSYVVVDGPCAEAVLRGSNIYTPGIWCLVDSQRRTAASGTADSGLWPGAAVVILVPKHGTVAPLKGSVLRRQPEKVVVDTSSVEEVDASSKTTFKPEDYIAVGRGLWTVSWRELISKQQELNQGKKRVRDAPPTTPSTPLQGDAAVFSDLAARNIAIVNTDTFTRSDLIGPVSMPPPPASEWYGSIGEIAIQKAHALRGEGGPPPRLQPLVFMAQNVSSMLPAVLLAAGIDEGRFSRDTPAMLLDACAAPGGKTSHLLGQLFTRRASSSWFKLQACDRSGSRAKSMQKLLLGQFPPALLHDSLKVHCGKDVGSLLKETTDPSTTTSNATPSVLFDGIILDPPCTCLGLRPRLSPHTHGAVAIRASADYQRLLLTRCLSQLKPGGRLVYSTCTISAEENEDTILWALANMADTDYLGPKAHLVRARNVDEMQFCQSALGKLAMEQVLNREAICGVDEDRTVDPLMVFRFMPNPSDSQHVGDQLADGVGFFVAVFERNIE